MKTDSKLQAKGDCNTLTTLVEEVRNLLSVHPPKTLASGSTDARKLLEPITKILQDVTAKEINLEVPVIPERFPRRALGYIPVWEQEDFEIGIFAFPPGAVIPLHDHPGMFVLSHVLYGSITVKSYDIDHETGETRRKETRLLKESESSLLFEHDRNIHEFTAGEDGCAVLDILAPPYDHDSKRIVGVCFDAACGFVVYAHVSKRVCRVCVARVCSARVYVHARERGRLGRLKRG